MNRYTEEQGEKYDNGANYRGCAGEEELEGVRIETVTQRHLILLIPVT